MGDIPTVFHRGLFFSEGGGPMTGQYAHTIDAKGRLFIPAALRRELGIREERMVLSIGQFIPRKGIDLLLQAARGLDKNVGIYIIGGKKVIVK